MMNTYLPKHTNYFSWPYRLGAALFVAWFLNTVTQYKSFFTLIQQRNYQEAFVFSFFMTLFIICGIQYISLYLDKHLPWEEKPLSRILAQLLTGVLGMILFTYFGVKIYFTVVNGDMLLSDYMVLEFPMVQISIAMLNVIYFCYYILVKKIIPQRSKTYLKGTLGRKLFFMEAKDILYLVREGKEGYAILKKGKKLHIAYKMSELEELLDPLEFFRVNRSLMVSRAIIAGYKPVKNMQCVLILKIAVPPELDLLVTRQRTEQLKKMLHKSAIQTEQKNTISLKILDLLNKLF